MNKRCPKSNDDLFCLLQLSNRNISKTLSSYNVIGGRPCHVAAVDLLLLSAAPRSLPHCYIKLVTKEVVLGMRTGTVSVLASLGWYTQGVPWVHLHKRVTTILHLHEWADF